MDRLDDGGVEWRGYTKPLAFGDDEPVEFVDFRAPAAHDILQK